MKYKHIVFDIDGTLVDNEYAILCSLCSTLQRFGRGDVPADKLFFALGIPSEAALRQLGFTDVEAPLQVWDEEMKRYGDTSQLFEQVEDMLEGLKAGGHQLGIITSKTQAEYEAEIASQSLDGYFDVRIFADMTKQHKPHPAPMVEYLRQAGAQRTDTLYIGDSPYDAQCAQGAGVDFALAGWGAPKYVPILADYHLDAPTEVFRIVR